MIKRLLSVIAMLPSMGAPLFSYTVTTGDQLWTEFLANPHDHSHIPDGSYAGYMRGEAPIPDYPVVVNLLDHGGVGDGVADNTEAFRAAIRAANMAGGGAILVPAGTYRVDGIISLKHSGISIRGEGIGSTIIDFQFPLESALGSTGFGTSKWNWAGGLFWIQPGTNIPERRGVPEFLQATPDGLTNGGPAHSWEYWFHGETQSSATGTHERGTFVITVDDASGLVAGTTYLMTYDNSQELFEEVGDHPLMVGEDYGSWLYDAASYPFWHWPVEVVKVDGNNVTLAQPLRLAVRPQYNVKIRELGPHVSQSGVEDLTIKGNARLTMGNNSSLGWNGIGFNKALNCWAKNVEIQNMENGVMISSGKNLSILGIRINGDRMMHHGFTCRPTTHDTLYDDFRIELTGGALGGMHGINTEWLSTGNVWSRGYMNQGTFDSHRAISFDYLRTEITLKNNKESNPGGASQAGRYTGRRAVHWNVAIDNSDRPDESGEDARGLYVYQHDQFVRGALVGIQGAPMCDLPPFAMPSGDKDMRVADEGLVPTQVNLYEAQLTAREEREAWILPDTLFPDAPMAPGDITVPVVASPPVPRTVSRVVLEVNGTDVADDTSAPYQLVWAGASSGAYEVRLRMEDDLGTLTWSPVYPVTVGTRLVVEDNDPDLIANTASYFNAPYFSEGRVRHQMEFLEYTFVGTRIRIFSGSTNGQMRGEAYLDDFGTPVKTFAISSSQPYSDRLVYDSGRIPDGVHHVRLVKTSENLVVDYILVDSTADVATVSVPPKAMLTATPDNGVAPLQVTLNAASSSDPDGTIINYEWDINGDGITDYTGVSAVHTFTTWANHTVSLKVTDNDGLSTISTLTVPVVEPMPVAAFSATPTSGPVPLDVSFDAAASIPSETFRNITSYAWDFEDDGIFDATGLTTSHTYTASGQHTARLRITDDFGRIDDATMVITAQNAAPVISLVELINEPAAALPHAILLPGSVSDDGIPASPGLSFTWSIVSQPPGAIGQFSDPSLLNPQFTMDVYGVYELQLEATDGDLISMDTVYISLQSNTSGGYISSGGQVVMEAEEFNRALPGENGAYWEIEFTQSGFSGGGYVVVPNGTTSSESDPLPVLEYEIDFQQTGTYRVWMRRSAPDWGANSAYYELNGLSRTQIDNNNSVPDDWIWKIGSTLLNITEAGPKTFRLMMREDGYRIDKIILTTATDPPVGGGPDESARDSNEPPAAIIAQDGVTGNAPFTVNFDGTGSTDDVGISSYAWDVFEDGVVDGTGSTFSHTFDAGGIYSVSLTVTDAGGKSHSASTTVTSIQNSLSLPPVASASVSPASGIAPLTITLDASGSFDADGEIVSFAWDVDGDGLTDVEGSLATYSLTEAGSYAPVLTVTNDSGLTASASAGTVTVSAPAIPFEDPSQYTIGASSYLGGTGDDDVVQVAIQSSGAIVLAANISDANPGGLTPILLNGATASSSGSVIRLSPDGQTVLSVTRLSGRVEDLSLDGDDNILVAAGSAGAVKLDPIAGSVLWNHPLNGYGMRIDAASDGRAVALNIVDQTDEGTVYIFDASGGLAGSFAGRNYSLDVAIDDYRDQIFLSGFKQDHSGCNPVQVAYLHAQAFDGSRLWSNYGWPGTNLDNCDGDGFENYMADTRGYRVDYGPDGLLYATFESAGGNHIMLVDPKDLDTPVDIVGGDLFSEFSNAGADHKTVFVKFNPANGDFILGQQLTGRIQVDSGWATNVVRVRYGGVTSDEAGRIYIWGQAGEGFPLPSHPLFNASLVDYPVDPFYPPGASNSGAFVMIADKSFQTRAMICRPATPGSMHGMGVRRLDSEPFPRMAFGGSVETSSLLYTLNPVQAAYGGGTTDGFFTVMNGPFGNIDPEASFAASTTAGQAPLSVSVDATLSVDVDGSITAYEWDFNGDGIWDATGVTQSHVYTVDGTYSLTLRVTDNLGAQSEDSVTISVGNRLPVAAFAVTPTSGVFPFTINMDASGSTDPDGSISSYGWDFDGDGTTDATGVTASLVPTRPGVVQIGLTVTDPDGAEDNLTRTVNAVVGDTRPVTESDGLFVLEAEDMTAFDQRSDSSGLNWIIEETLPGFLGSGYIRFPGSQAVAELSADAASVSYLVDSSRSGTVRVWIRRLASDGLTNSIYWGVSGGSVSEGDNSTDNLGYWKWISLGTTNLGTGLQQLDIYHRESGYAIDRIAISYDLFWSPERSGPDAAPRTGNAPPVAIISPSSTSGSSPLIVDFDGTGSFDSDGSIVSWSWDFDNDGTEDATGSLVQFIYPDEGTYVASLLVTDNAGAFGYDTVTIEVDPNQSPVALAQANETTGAVPVTIQFDGSGSSDPDGSVVAWAWDFDGDWVTDATGPNVSHAFTSGGVFDVVLQVSDDRGATDIHTIQITVLNPPTAAFNATPASGDFPLTVSFNASASSDPDGTITAYAWDFGDGGLGSGVTTSHIYTSEGSFTATLTVTDSDGETDTASTVITVTRGVPVPVIQATPSTGSYPLVVQFDGSGSLGSGLSYSWDFGDGATATGPTASHTYPEKGNMTVTLSVDDGIAPVQTTTESIIVTAPAITIPGLLYHEDFEYVSVDGSPLIDQVNWTGQTGWAVRSTSRGGGNDAGKPEDYVNGEISILTGSRSAAYVTGAERSSTDDSLVDQTGTVFVSFIGAKAKSTSSFELAPLKITASNSSNLAIDLSTEPGNPGTGHQWITASTNGHATYVGLDRGFNSYDDGIDLFIVAKFSKEGSPNYNRVDLWVNPSTTDGTTGYIGYATGDSGTQVFEGLTMGSNNMETSYIDEIRIATNFAAAVGVVPAEPFPGPIDYTFGESLVLFELLSAPGYTYRIQTSQTMEAGSWSYVGVPVAGTGGVIQLSLPTPVLGGDPVFYRLEAAAD